MLVSTESFDGIPDVIELLKKNNPGFIVDSNNPIQYVAGRHGRGLGSPYGATNTYFAHIIPERLQSSSVIVGWSYRLETVTIPSNGIAIIEIDQYELILNADRSISLIWNGSVRDTSDPGVIVFGENAYLEVKIYTSFFELRKNTVTILKIEETFGRFTYNIDALLSSKFTSHYFIDANLGSIKNITYLTDASLSADFARITQVFEEVITSAPVVSPARITTVYEEVIVKP